MELGTFPPPEHVAFMGRHVMKVWITKYALTDGIREIEAEISDTSPTMITHYASDSGRSWMTHFHGNDWHHTPEQAATRAEEMRQKAIASAHKRLAKLEKLSFAL